MGTNGAHREASSSISCWVFGYFAPGGGCVGPPMSAALPFKGCLSGDGEASS
jgi:hypothetical protein